METLWFVLVAATLTVYVVLDGFDLGAGIVSLFVARDEEERSRVIESIAPFWDGNEVWLLAGGGTLYFAFPVLYASSFQGFYLPLMMVLWLLMLRGIAIEFRHHVSNPMWRPVWDLAFGGASALLAIFYGAALGNVVRGVPLDQSAEFFLPLWTDWTPGANPGVLDWYTVSVGALTFAALALHGGLWVAAKTGGELNTRAARFARMTGIAVATLVALVTWASFSIQPQLARGFAARPWLAVFPALAIAGLAGTFALRGETTRFGASCVFLLGMMTSAAAGVFPFVLPSSTDPSLSLTVFNTAAAGYGLRVGLWWWLPGVALAGFYMAFLYRRFAGKVESGAH